MKIITLGSCCKKSKQNHENAVIAAKNCGVDEPINVSDTMEIMKFGVMSTPALVIDGKVVAMGRMLSVEQIEELIINKSLRFVYISSFYFEVIAYLDEI